MNELRNAFVLPEASTPDPKCLQPASYLRKTFTLTAPVRKATLYATALGVFVPYVNGTLAHTSRLLPGFTNYHKRLQVIEVDVTALLHNGENVIAALLGDGWYRGCLGAFSQRAFYGDTVAFAAALKLETEAGVSWVRTDEQTRATQSGPIRGNDLKTYEIVDARLEMPGWNDVGFDDSAWHYCRKGDYAGELIGMEGVNISEHERFSPRVLRTPNGETVLDFGQNLAGHVAFTVTGKAGDRVMLELGETLDENGNFTVKNLSGEGHEAAESTPVREGMEIPKNTLGQTLAYILKDGRQSYAPAFLQSGFRYARLTGWPEEVRAENFTAAAVYADIPYAGSFRCSDERVNRLVENVRWSQKSNFVEIPTDCPTRERAGWTGDINVFCETACYLSDPRQFLLKWLGDFAGLQKENGSLPFLVPEIPLTAEGADMMNLPWSSAGWSDALLQVSMTLYRFYGDAEPLRLVYEAAKHYVDFNTKRAKQKHKLHFYKLGRHYRYILDTGYHWGEWLEPGSSMTKDAIRALAFPDSEVATAWFYRSADLLCQMASILGKAEDARKYAALADNIKAAYQKEFLHGGKVRSKRQCRFVRPVSMGLVDEKTARAIVKDLNALCVKNDYKIGTGFLTTWQVLQTLSDFGYHDTAWKMLTQSSCPGWMYEISKGATTTWENWMGIDENGAVKDSQNHYAPGAATAWLFSHVGGIRPMEPGFAKVKIAPTPIKELDWAETCFGSVHGEIRTRWERSESQFKLSVSLPEGVTAVAVLPDGTERCFAGMAELTCNL